MNNGHDSNNPGEMSFMGLTPESLYPQLPLSQRLKRFPPDSHSLSGPLFAPHLLGMLFEVWFNLEAKLQIKVQLDCLFAALE